VSNMILKPFGLELRRIDSPRELFITVNSVLKKYDIPSKGVNATVQSAAIGHALHKMINSDSHFSVCMITQSASISKVVICKERMDIYSSIHCMNWSEMDKDFRQNIVAMILDDFSEVLNPQEITATEIQRI